MTRFTYLAFAILFAIAMAYGGAMLGVLIAVKAPVALLGLVGLMSLVSASGSALAFYSYETD